MTRDPAEAMLAEFRALAERMGIHRLPTLLSYAEAARELGLKLTQFKTKYVTSGRIDVYQEPGMRPRVPSSEIVRIVAELREASRRSNGPANRQAKPPDSSRARATKRHGAEEDSARFMAELKKRNRRSS